jgi:hypothetical protein
MRLTPEQIEQIRLSILRHLDANAAAGSAFGISTSLLLQFVKNEGFSQLDKETISVELQYLTDKNFIATVPKLISPENKHWRITADGRDFFAQQG